MFTNIDTIAPVLATWIVSASALAWLTRRVIVRSPWRRLRRLGRSERGAAYTLSVVLVLPIFILLIAVITETTLLLQTKIGTSYAAFAAARTAAVWLPFEPFDVDARERIHQAAIAALTPFASSRDVHLEPARTSGGFDTFEAEGVRAALNAMSDTPIELDLVARKRAYATLAVDPPKIEIVPTPRGATATVTVTYHAPFHTGVGRLFGRRPPWPNARFFTYPITSQATLDVEVPYNRLGRKITDNEIRETEIHYAPKL